MKHFDQKLGTWVLQLQQGLYMQQYALLIQEKLQEVAREY